MSGAQHGGAQQPLVNSTLLPWWLKEGRDFTKEARAMTEKLDAVAPNSPRKQTGRDGSPGWK